MSFFAGVFARRQGNEDPLVPRAVIETITRSISRADDEAVTYEAPGFFLAKVDTGVFPTPAWLVPAEGAGSCFAALAGHPFLEDDAGGSEDRGVQLEHLATAIAEGRNEILRRCQGMFAFCYFDPEKRTLVLAADKLCNRPLYVCIGEDYVFFSTALRVLEALEEVPKRMDVQGMAEQMALGFPLADRTPYADIKLLHAAEMLACEGGAVRRERYFRWDEIPPTELSMEELLSQTYERFRFAVERRCLGEDWAVATLSGGLDSRCCVTVLKECLQKRVYTASFAPPGQLDGPLAVEFARVLGVANFVRPMPIGPTFREWARLQMDFHWPDEGSDPPQTHRIMRGDGGSVGLGHDYLTKERVELLRQGRQDEVVRQLAAAHRLPTGFMRPSAYPVMEQAIRNGLAAEFQNIRCADRGRDLHVFYLHNDQRRHMHRYFENMDLHRFEHVEPFYDGGFLELVVSGPIDAFLRHKFYHEWLDRFPPVIKSVAWQTYPGHVPCPVKTSVSARTQWQRRRRDAYSGRHREAFWRCADALPRRDFPRSFFNRPRLLAALILHGLRLRPYGWVFSHCAELQSVYSKCGGVVGEPFHAADDHAGGAHCLPLDS